MISDSLVMNPKLLKLDTTEKNSKFLNEFLPKRKNLKNLREMSSSHTNQKLIKLRSFKHSDLSMTEGLPRFNAKVYQQSTPSNSFHLFDSSKRLTFQSKFQRPISVEGNNQRPLFLEPEVSRGHSSNKSAFITPSRQLNESDAVTEPYKFPFFRAKKITGFKLSVSPDPSEKKNTPKKATVTANDVLRISKTHRPQRGNFGKSRLSEKLLNSRGLKPSNFLIEKGKHSDYDLFN